MDGRICVSNVDSRRQEVLEDYHRSKLSICLGVSIMYLNIKRVLWWKGIKRDISIYVSRCLNYQQVKGNHQKTAGLLQPLEIPNWKWKMISMDFINGLSRTRRGNKGIWFIMDQLMKSAHFIPVKHTRTAASLADLYMKEIVRFHGVPLSIVSDRDPIFTS